MKLTLKEKVFRGLCISNKYIFGTIGNFTRKEIIWFEKMLRKLFFPRNESLNVWLDLEKELK